MVILDLSAYQHCQMIITCRSVLSHEEENNQRQLRDAELKTLPERQRSKLNVYCMVFFNLWLIVCLTYIIN